MDFNGEHGLNASTRTDRLPAISLFHAAAPRKIGRPF
jgi:hypothetical protein